MIWDITYEPCLSRRMRYDGQHITSESTRWVAPSEWTEAQVKADFERRYSGSRVLTIAPGAIRESA